MGIATKKEIVKRKIVEEHGCVGACTRCAQIHRFIDLMEEAKIPVGYWFLGMKEFKGSDKLKTVIEDYITNIKQKYAEGKSVCLSGNQGTGKTMSSICILKAAIKNNFSAYYITASDLLNEMTDFQSNHELRATLKDVDFLLIDELDSRFFPSDSAKELFSGIYENIFRFRTHNNLPTIICTNETEGILNVFYGPGVQSISSLNSQYLEMYAVAGIDFRKQVQ
jgi:DNA replication protein DnaC